MNQKTQDYIERIEEIFGDKYDYSLVTDVKNAKEKINIRCVKHNFIFKAPIYHLLEGHGCPECKKDRLRKLKAFTKDEFQKKLDSKYGPIYTITSPYVNNSTKIICLCSKCGKYFSRKPSALFFGAGCTNCLSSKLEQKVAQALEDECIIFVREKTFPWLGGQRLDFFLPEYNIAIECQGEQHFIPKKLYGGEEGLQEIKDWDYKKFQNCHNHNVPILYIAEKSHIYFSNIITNIKNMIDSILIHPKIEKWDGKVPTIVGGSNTMFDMSKFQNK